MKFRKKPVVVDAVQFLGDENYNECAEFMGITDNEQYGDIINIRTMEGIMRCSKFDWIIKGVNGEFYPCKPDVFEKTYEPVE